MCSSARSTPAIMIQGTGSNVGKSLIVAGLCRLFSRRGLRVRPFKPQNMSNNAAVTADGGEIGRAQALQAQAAGVTPSVHMNPVLLKPEADKYSQIVIQGQRAGRMRARDFGKHKGELLPKVLESFNKISCDADLVIVEGAGSPAEVNLRAGDIANMGFAEAADMPVILVGDIDRGGVIASLVGTHVLVSEEERARVKGFLINKFRGDVSLFTEGERLIAERTRWPSLGVLPFFERAAHLPAEDSSDIRSSVRVRRDAGRCLKIAVPVISRIANFDDLDPLKLEPGVSLDFVQPGDPLPNNADLILLPGSKSTMNDLKALRFEGWDIDIAAHIRAGKSVVGLCGGYQMLGRTIADPEGIEGEPGSCDGLGHLNVDTVLGREKCVRLVHGHEIESGLPVSGYEIHLGKTKRAETERPWLLLENLEAGSISKNGRVFGCYLHGLFASDVFRRSFLRRLGGGEGSHLNYAEQVDWSLDRLSEHLEVHLNVDHILSIAKTHSGL